jgi:hypothetical protein
MEKLSFSKKEKFILEFLQDGNFYPESFVIKKFKYLEDPKIPNSIELLISSLLVQGKIFRSTLQEVNYLGLSKNSEEKCFLFGSEFEVLRLNFMISLKK